jgi:hypothetical protein
VAHWKWRQVDAKAPVTLVNQGPVDGGYALCTFPRHPPVTGLVQPTMRMLASLLLGLSITEHVSINKSTHSSLSLPKYYILFRKNNISLIHLQLLQRVNAITTHCLGSTLTCTTVLAVLSPSYLHIYKRMSIFVASSCCGSNPPRKRYRNQLTAMNIRTRANNAALPRAWSTYGTPMRQAMKGTLGCASSHSFHTPRSPCLHEACKYYTNMDMWCLLTYIISVHICACVYTYICMYRHECASFERMVAIYMTLIRSKLSSCLAVRGQARVV